MDFVSIQLSTLMEAVPTDVEAAAEWTNLCLEERVTPERQTTYEALVGQPPDWPAWRESHYRYVQEAVRRRHPLSAAFDGGDALRPHLEANQELYRVERIDSVLTKYATEAGVPVDGERIRQWISTRDVPLTSSTLADAGTSSPEHAALADLTQFLNDELADGRPRFVALAAEFPRLEEQPDWPRTICERCGLAHHCTGTPVTLALFRYSVREVLTAYRETETGTPVFAVPTVLDLPMSNVYFSAPTSLHSGHAVGLAPRSDCAHLAAELIHARMDYRPEHWVAVSIVGRDAVSPEEIDRLRVTHLECLRRTPGNEEYGSNCVA